MSKITTDRNDPALHETNPETQQQEAYLVMEANSEFIRPIRTKYIHTSCGVETVMSRTIAETYARKPSFYSHTFCIACKKHLPVDEFVWSDTNEKVGS
jgi:hypothetical protein